MPDQASVLVVGAGPVGLTAAHELARRGIRVRLVDAAPGPARTSRAVAVHPRTLETLDQMGVAEQVLASGRHNKAFTMYAGGRRLVRLEADYSTMPTRFPYTVVIEQTRTEELLREACARLGVTPEWGVRLTGLGQDEHGVRARLAHGDGSTEEYESGWLVGCDGGHSTVRKELALPLLGESSETWELADAPVAMDLPPDTIYWVHSGGQALMMVPYLREGHWRLLDTAPTARPGTAGTTHARESAQRLSARLSAGLGTDVRVGEPEWTSVFTFQQRMVPRMHDGRVFVAGDAAHVHSPASGQGMNTGVQEAYNLSWKLAMAARGQAGRSLLDTYGQERVPVGRALLGSTRQATFLVQLKNTLAGVLLPAVFAVVRAAPPLRRAIQRKVLGGMSGLTLGYPASPLTGADGGLRAPAGSRAAALLARLPEGPAAHALRAELRDTRWTLLYAPASDESGLVAEEAAAAAGDWLCVRAVGARPGTASAPLPDPDGALRDALGPASGSWALIRPDGYLAAGGHRLTAPRLEEALAVLGPVLLHRSSGRSPAAADTVETTTRVLEGRR